jgi:tetratricopeptide (TPR) repeat protein
VKKSTMMVALVSIGFATCSATAAGTNQVNSTSVHQQAPRDVSPELRADILVARKMYREAIEAYKDAGLDSATILHTTGIAYRQFNDGARAKSYYERAAKLKPDYPEAINNLRTVYYAQKSYRRAIPCHKKALELEPRSAPFLSNLGTAYFARKNYELAFATYQAALKIDPEVFENRSSHENRSSQGSTVLERSVEERAKFHLYLAKAYAKQGTFYRALLYLRKALEEGFKEKDMILSAAEFAPLKDNEEFQRITAMEQRVL